MKKLFSIAAAIVILCANAYACDTNILPTDKSSAVYTDCTYWVVHKEYKELIGIISPTEEVPVLGMQASTLTVLRGAMSNGLIRVPGRAQVMDNDDKTIGLAVCNNSVVYIHEEYLSIVEEIVVRRTGEEMCGKTVIASTIWRTGSLVSHIFWTNQHVFAVGAVAVGGTTVTIWCGDFDGDGAFELGFKAGTSDYYVKPTVTPAPTKHPCPEPTRYPCPTEANPTTCMYDKDKDSCHTVLKLCFRFCLTISECK